MNRALLIAILATACGPAATTGGTDDTGQFVWVDAKGNTVGPAGPGVSALTSAEVPFIDEAGLIWSLKPQTGVVGTWGALQQLYGSAGCSGESQVAPTGTFIVRGVYTVANAPGLFSVPDNAAIASFGWKSRFISNCADAAAATPLDAIPFATLKQVTTQPHAAFAAPLHVEYR